MGKPASMMSTPSLARLRAMSSFSLEVRVAPDGFLEIYIDVKKVSDEGLLTS